MTYQLIPSLTDVGGVIVEGYKRLTRADDDEKVGVGKLEGEDVFASVGIASIEEYITMNVTDLGRREVAVFDLSQFDQSMRVASLYIDEPSSDTVIVEVFLPGDIRILKQIFSRSKTPFTFPPAPLPNNVTIKVTALSDTKFIQLVLIPVVILETIEGTKEEVRGT